MKIGRQIELAGVFHFCICHYVDRRLFVLAFAVTLFHYLRWSVRHLRGTLMIHPLLVPSYRLRFRSSGRLSVSGVCISVWFLLVLKKWLTCLPVQKHPFKKR